MAVRKHGSGWQVRVRPFPEIVVPSKAAAETVELDLKLRKKLGHLYREKSTTFGAELDARFARKQAMGGKRGKLRPQDCSLLRAERQALAATPQRAHP